MCSDLTVAENIYLGREKHKWGIIDQKHINAEGKEETRRTEY